MRHSFKRKFNHRLEAMFSSKAEVKLLQILGARTLTIDNVISKRSGRSFTIILSRGSILRRERFHRAGGGLLTVANDLKWGIAIQGREYERDVVAAYEQDELLYEQGFRVQFVPANWLWSDPLAVKTMVLQFLK